LNSPSFCVSFLGAGITGVCHHTWLVGHPFHKWEWNFFHMFKSLCFLNCNQFLYIAFCWSFKNWSLVTFSSFLSFSLFPSFL
jgi:hypothetical protein